MRGREGKGGREGCVCVCVCKCNVCECYSAVLVIRLTHFYKDMYQKLMA